MLDKTTVTTTATAAAAAATIKMVRIVCYLKPFCLNNFDTACASLPFDYIISRQMKMKVRRRDTKKQQQLQIQIREKKWPGVCSEMNF